MSLRANVSERGNLIDIIYQLVICPIREITTHSSNVRNDMKLCGQAIYLIENGKWKMENCFVFYFPSLGGREENRFEFGKMKI